MSCVDPAQPRRWIEVGARVSPDDSEPVADVLREAGAEGVVIEPALRISDTANFAYEELRDRPWLVRGYLPAPFEHRERRALRRRLRELPLSGPLPPLRYSEVVPEDWTLAWKQYYHVLHIGRRLVVRPSWEPYEPRGDQVVVELDPGAAFGTGQHETTRLCLEALERHVSPGMDAIDVGAGSGILAIAAVKLGARSVLALDNDPGTISVARENAQRNGVQGQVVLAAGSLGADWPWPERSPREAADLVLANTSSTSVVELMPDLVAALRPGGLLVASGFIARDTDDVRADAAAAGLDEVAVAAEGDWRCLVARRPAS